MPWEKRLKRSTSRAARNCALATSTHPQQKTPWKAFAVLKDSLGEQSFQTCVRSALSVADKKDPPLVYQQIWDLNVAGVLTLNLDRFVTRALSLRHPGRPSDEFPGSDAGKCAHLVKSPTPFIANLHGTAANADSWVFSESELRRLLSVPGYQEFVNACFLAHTVVFCGISADDVAAGGFLERLTQRGVDAGPHYWITHRNDLPTNQWAEEAGLQPIYYNADSEHSGLSTALQELINATPVEESPLPVMTSEVVSKPGEDSIDDDPDSLEIADPEVARRILNRKALDILQSECPSKYDEYKTFCEQFDAAIHRAYYVKPGTNRDKLLGFKVLDQLGAGAFGTVFRAQDPEGDPVALKLLHESIRNEQERLQGFRRGVASMQILERRKVEGIVPYKMACEIPAFAVMDLVPGCDLQEAVRTYGLRDWQDILFIAKQIVEVIRRSHRLPERVLHRDIRPHNIMIKNPWDEVQDWEVVVLDFDLSWHRDAMEVSIEEPGALNGYLAPEMLQRQGAVSTRSALVDSFGLGMTLFFMREKRDPVPMESSHAVWPTTLNDAAERWRCREWASLPRRFFRLVERATRPTQSERIDVSQMDKEMDRLLGAAVGAAKVVDAGMWAEEIAANANGIPYGQAQDLRKFYIELAGLTIHIAGDDLEGVVAVEISWTQLGNERYEGVRKWLPRACDQVNSRMRNSGWSGKMTVSSYQIDGKFTASIAELRQRGANLKQGFSEAVEACQFRG